MYHTYSGQNYKQTISLEKDFPAGHIYFINYSNDSAVDQFCVYVLVFCLLKGVFILYVH